LALGQPPKEEATAPATAPSPRRRRAASIIISTISIIISIMLMGAVLRGQLGEQGKLRRGSAREIPSAGQPT
jgi:hypothetical protein